MEKRNLGNSDFMITPVGYGAWAIGGGGWQFGWGPQNDSDSVAAIHRSLELGVNWIDTAAVYGLGHSEEIAARAVAEWKGGRPLVFTKCGLLGDAQGRVSQSHKAGSIRKECEESLRRLKVDVIDLYQMHWPPNDNGPGLEEAWTAMAELQRQGKVRWIGVSNFDVPQMKRSLAIAAVTSLQPPYSILRRDIEAEILPFCKQQGIGVIVYAPMFSGLLTGAMTRERAANLPQDDWRRNHPEFNAPNLIRNLELVERLRVIGKRHGRTPGEVAIAWTLRHPAVTAAIVGAHSAKQADGVMGAAELRLTLEEINEIEAAAGRQAA